MSELFAAVLTDKTLRTPSAVRKAAVNSADTFTPWQSAEGS